MIKPEQIPIEVMNAFHLALLHDESYVEAIAAALNAWPGADQYLGAVVLPLPQEARDE